MGVRQWIEWRGKIQCATDRKGDQCCSRCKSATVRADKTRCWICGAWMKDNGTAGNFKSNTSTGIEADTKNSEAGLPKDMPLTAVQWAAKRKGPPNSATFAIARQTCICIGTELDKDGDEDFDDLDTDVEGETKTKADAVDFDKDVLGAAQVASFKSLLDFTSFECRFV